MKEKLKEIITIEKIDSLNSIKDLHEHYNEVQSFVIAISNFMIIELVSEHKSHPNLFKFLKEVHDTVKYSTHYVFHGFKMKKKKTDYIIDEINKEYEKFKMGV